jgi:predicted metal-dependent HD superfamily phosphohydrolase
MVQGGSWQISTISPHGCPAMLAEWSANGSQLPSNHIVHLIDMYDEWFLDQMTDRENTIMHYAFWFHDIVYDPTSKDNERNSADMARACLDLPADDMAMLDSIIMDTAGHKASSRLGQIMVDLDLSILATRWPRYCQYAIGIRQEYSHVPEEMYRARRIEVLDHLCSLDFFPVLCPTMGWQKEELGLVAINNMRAEQAALRTPGVTVELSLTSVSSAP